MSSQAENAAANLELKKGGQGTVILLNDTTQATGDFKEIYVVANAVFNTLTSNVTKNGISTAAVAADFGTVAAGTTLKGKFTTVKLTSGSVILYG